MEKVKVVLIDDERIVLNGIKALLKRERNLEIAGAADNGLDGLRLVLEERPELVLTDIRMPGMSGLERIRQAKELKEKGYKIREIGKEMGCSTGHVHKLINEQLEKQ